MICLVVQWFVDEGVLRLNLFSLIKDFDHAVGFELEKGAEMCSYLN